MHALVFALVSTLAASILMAEAPKGEASRSTTPPTVATESLSARPLLTPEMVAAWVKRWQSRLNLQEWTIEAKIVRQKDLPKNAVANIRWSLGTRKATIRVLDPVDSSLKASEIVRDTELSVVHELVHLSMAKLPLDPNHTDLEEEAVKRLSVALMSLEKAEAAAAAAEK
ncbi:MAG TPA: hypothetical protein VE621_10120 [Bryobacteraceae bacterium]|nr:hypothetical protein [Bryobacteraceae bacterium]